jgi:small conductance mechanosensitive channel
LALSQLLNFRHSDKLKHFGDSSLRTGFRFTLLFLSLTAAVSVWSQETNDQQAPLTVPSDERAMRFEQLRDEIAREQREINRLDARITSSEGVAELVLIARRDMTRIRMFKAILVLAREVAAERDSGADVTIDVDEVIDFLKPLPAHAFEAVERIRARLVFPTNETPPAEFVILDQEWSQGINNLDGMYSVIVDYLDIADQYDMQVENDVAALGRQLSDNAANRSVFLELAAEELAHMRQANSILPTNDELTERLHAVQARVDLVAAALQRSIALMSSLELDTQHYRQQVLAATGEITTDVLDVGFLSGLISEWSDSIVELTKTEGPRLLFRLVLSVVVLLTFMQLGKLVQKIVGRALSPDRVNLSHLLREMILAAVKNLVILMGALIALAQLGISLGPLLAGLGIAGFIIGFALQDSLSNFASGMMILIYRPFDVGDFVDITGVQGKIYKMSLVNTTFLTVDNRKLVLPNNMIWKSVITNYTDQETRRVDLVFGISYGDDINKAEAVIRETLAKFDAILDEPETVVRVYELGESSVNLIVRPWVRTEDYWETYWGLTKEVKLAFDKAGITIPFPQRDLNVIESSATPVSV